VSYTASDASGVAKLQLYAQAPGQSAYALAGTDTSGAGSGNFNYTANSGAGTYSFYTIATDRAGNRQATPSTPDATTSVTNATTSTISAPTVDTAGTTIASSSISAALSGATTGAAGTLTVKVFGPQATAPASCTSGGATVGTASVSGNRTYNPGSFTPAASGDYWWYVNYSGDSSNAASSSACGAAMSKTTVYSATSATSAMDTSLKSSTTTSTFAVRPSTTYLLFIFRDTGSADGVNSISSTGLTPALTSSSFTAVTSQKFSSTNQWAYYVTTSSAAAGTGSLTITFKKALTSGEATLIDLVALGGNSASAPIVMTNIGLNNGSSSTITAKLPNAPNPLDAGIVFLTGPQDFGATAPLATPSMANIFYSHQPPASLAAYFAAPGQQTESLKVASPTKSWGTVSLEIKGG
jgi:hypothetical protein